MGAFIIVLILVVCFLLAGVILVQNPKGGGLATGFQGASQIGGVQKTADFLEKSTWYLTIGLFVLCLVSAKFYGNGNSEGDGTFKEDSQVDVVDQSGIDISNAGNEEPPASE